MVGWMDDWNEGVGCFLVVAWAYGRLIHARGPLPTGLRGFTPRQRPSRSTTNKQPTHTFIQPCIHPSNHPSVHPPIHSPIHPHIHPFHPSIHPPFHSSTHPFIHPSVHPPIRSSTHPFIHPSVRPPIHSHPSILPIHSFILATLHPPTLPSTHVQADTAYLNPPHLSKGQIHRHQPHAPIETQCNQTL